MVFARCSVPVHRSLRLGRASTCRPPGEQVVQSSTSRSSPSYRRLDDLGRGKPAVLTYSELHDDELVETLAHDPRTGCLALWSVTLVFVLPGLLDHELALLGIG